MSVYRPKNSPFYHYDFQMRGHRFYGSTGETKKRDAVAAEAEAKRRAKDSLNTTDGPRDVTLDDAAGEFWLNSARHQSSASTQKNEINSLIRIIGKTTLISEINDSVVAGFVARRRGEHSKLFKPEKHPADFVIPLVSPATVNRDTKTLKRIIKRAVRVLRAKQPPEHSRPDWKLHTLAEADPPDRPLTFDQEQRLFQELVPHTHPIVDTVLLTGLRLSEVMTLDCRNIDFSTMRAGVWRKSKKHGKEWFSFAITEPLFDIFLPHVDARDEGALWRFGPHCDCKTCHKKTNHGRPIKDITTGFDAACARAGIPDFRFHDLRHTVGTRALVKGGIKAAMDTLGHKSITTTNRYAHHAPNALADLQRDLAEMRPPKPGQDKKSRNNPELPDAARQKINKINTKTG